MRMVPLVPGHARLLLETARHFPNYHPSQADMEFLVSESGLGAKGYLLFDGDTPAGSVVGYPVAAELDRADLPELIRVYRERISWPGQIEWLGRHGIPADAANLWHIWQVTVEESHRGRGHATALFRAFIESPWVGDGTVIGFIDPGNWVSMAASMKAGGVCWGQSAAYGGYAEVRLLRPGQGASLRFEGPQVPLEKVAELASGGTAVGWCPATAQFRTCAVQVPPRASRAMPHWA